jgi:hypothetical protein
MKTTTVQDLGIHNEIHLCRSCCHEQPTCSGDNLIFGSGKGDDNVAACGQYEPIELRHPKHDGCGTI